MIIVKVDQTIRYFLQLVSSVAAFLTCFLVKVKQTGFVSVCVTVSTII